MFRVVSACARRTILRLHRTTAQLVPTLLLRLLSLTERTTTEVQAERLQTNLLRLTRGIAEREAAPGMDAETRNGSSAACAIGG